MSASARWANTATATLWPIASPPGWTGVASFGAPVTFRCDYQGKTMLSTNSVGREFVSRLQLYTERAGIKEGDRVLIGASSAQNPATAGAFEVKGITRYADTFDRKADDYVVMT